jgi:uncharacterized protein (TIGR03067 family)
MIPFRRPIFVLLGLALATGCAKPPIPDDGTTPFQGVWHAVGSDGKKIGKTVTFTNNLVTITEIKTTGKKTQVTSSPRSSFRVDSTTSPAHLDFVILEGADIGKTRLGIFAFEDHRLKICLADIDAPPRPTNFVAGDKTTMLLLER